MRTQGHLSSAFKFLWISMLLSVVCTFASSAFGGASPRSGLFEISGSGTPATITSPAPGSKLSSASATFQWSAGTGVTQYSLYIGTTAGAHDTDFIAAGTALSATVNNLPIDGGTFYVTLYSLINGSWQAKSYTYIATGTGTVGVITSPAPGAKLGSSSAMFTWAAGTGITQYSLYVGSRAGLHDIAFINAGKATSYNVTVLPTNGSTFYVTLYSLNGATWFSKSYTYIASGTGTAGVMTSPTPGSKLASSSATFTWAAGTGISQYSLYVGSAPGGHDLAFVNAGTLLSTTVNNLPTNGGAFYVTLYSLNGNTWFTKPYIYIASGTGTPAAMTSPAAGSTLTNTTVTFSWSAGAGVSQYTLYVGTTSGAHDIAFVNAGHSTSTTVNNLPGTGQKIYVTLYSYIGATWYTNAYIYTAYTVPMTTHLTSVSLNANHLAWDTVHGRIYASLPSVDGANGNSVAAVNPLDGTYPTPTYVGSEPNLLSVSSDGSYLLVSLDGSNSVQRMGLPAMSTDINVPLPSVFFGPQIALSLEAAPISPHSFAILMGTNSTSPPDTGGVAIYDDSAVRATKVPGFGIGPNISYLQWGASDAVLYGQNGSDSGFELFAMGVNASGVTVQKRYGNVIRGYNVRISFDKPTGFIFANNGQVVNPATGDRMGSLNLSAFQNVGGVVADPTQSVVFVVGQTYSQYSSGTGMLIEAFDKNTLVPLRSISISSTTGTPVSALCWGRAGLAVQTLASSISSSAIYFVEGYFVNPNVVPDFSTGTEVQALPRITSMSPQSVITGSSGTTLTVTGTNFQPTDSMYWNGIPLSTSFVNSTRLQATIPGTKLAAPGIGNVTVRNNAAQSSLNVLAFTVLDSGSTLIAENLASTAVAWDKFSSRLFVGVLSADSQYPNTMVAIDPTSGMVKGAAAVGSDPYLVSTSDDGSLLYSGLATSNYAVQFHLPGLTTLSHWSLGADYFDGPFVAMQIQPAPGAAHTTAISVGNPGYSAENAGAAIYDDTVARGTRLTGYNALLDSVQWGSNDSTLYGANNETTGYNFYTMGVSSVGLALLHNYPGAFSGFSIDIHFDAGTGYIYSDDGKVINPATGSGVGSYASSGLVVPDSSLDRVFIFGQTAAQMGTSSYTVASFSQTHFTPVTSITLNNLVGTPYAMVRWGTSGLALVTYTKPSATSSNSAGMLYIVNDATFVSASGEPHSQVPSIHLTWDRTLPDTTPFVPKNRMRGGARIFQPLSEKGTGLVRNAPDQK